MDPLDLRLKNATRKGDSWVGGGPVHSDGFISCLQAVRELAEWDRRSTLAARPGTRRSLGLACSSHISGLLSTGAIIRVLEDGTVVLNTGAVDIGQGSDTVLSQICADSLQIPIDRVIIGSPDTDSSPYNWGTTASRVTYMVGRAIVTAAAEVEEKLKAHAADIFECSPEDLTLRPGGKIGIVGIPRPRAKFSGCIVARALGGRRPDHGLREPDVRPADHRSETYRGERESLSPRSGCSLSPRSFAMSRLMKQPARSRSARLGQPVTSGRQSILGLSKDRSRAALSKGSGSLSARKLFGRARKSPTPA